MGVSGGCHIECSVSVFMCSDGVAFPLIDTHSVQCSCAVTVSHSLSPSRVVGAHKEAPYLTLHTVLTHCTTHTPSPNHHTHTHTHPPTHTHTHAFPRSVDAHCTTHPHSPSLSHTHASDGTQAQCSVFPCFRASAFPCSVSLYAVFNVAFPSHLPDVSARTLASDFPTSLSPSA